MQPSVREIVRQVEELSAPLAADEGCEVWGVTLSSEAGHWVLRILIDSERGTTLDDCTRVHRQVSDLLDVHDPIPWRYTLEVSSPGLRRPLLRPSHYRRYLGEPVRLQTRTAQDGKRTFTGPLCRVEDHAVSLVDDVKGTVSIAWDDVARAHLDPPPPVPGKDVPKSSRRRRRQQGRTESCSRI